MKKNLIKFLITVSILLTTFSTNIFAQNRISGEKLEKLLTENHIIIYDFFGPLRNNIELNFNANKTYKLNGVFPISAISIHPSSGNWEIVGFGNSSVRLTDIQNQNQYSDKKASFQLLFGDDGNIYNLNQKLYSYRLENKKERIENNARRIEEERIAEELRLKKIEEEKRQLAIKREQERIKAEQIKKEEERKRLELAEWAKKEEEERIKRENEERIKLEREELFKNILKYSLIFIGITILAIAIYYINKFHKNKAKILFLNLQKTFKNKFTTLSALISNSSQPLNLKDFNISKSAIFKMINCNTFNIKFKKKILKEEFFEFLNKNLENKLKWKCSALDSQVFQFYILNSYFRYQWGNNYKYAEEISNLVNKKFSSLESLTNDEIFEFKSLLSEKLKDNGKITIGNKITIWIVTPIMVLILWINIYNKFISDKRFLKEIDYAICEAFGDPYNKLRRSNDPRDWDTYDFRYGNCIKERIARSKPVK
jgi:hypothetical protein